MSRSDFLEKATTSIERYHMLSHGDTVIVGLSGGADSTALLYLLNDLKMEYNLTLIAAHLNHGIRGAEADRDERFCKELCKKLGIQIYAFHIDIPSLAKERGVSEEVAGRDARYEFFTGLAGERGKIATAHNAQDSVETLMLNLCRGTGLRGLTGIPPVRTIAHPVGCHGDEIVDLDCGGDCATCKGNCGANIVDTLVIRPLIECTREDIEEYLSSKGQDFVTDSTNLEDDYTRNRVRHNIIPELLKVNENAIGNITRCLDTIRDDSAFIERAADELLSSARHGDTYDVRTLQDADKAILTRAISTLIHDACGTYPEKVHIMKVIDMMNVGRTDQVQVPSGAFARVEKGKLFIKLK